MNMFCDIPLIAHVTVSDTALIVHLSNLSIPIALCSSAAAKLSTVLTGKFLLTYYCYHSRVLRLSENSKCINMCEKSVLC